MRFPSLRLGALSLSLLLVAPHSGFAQTTAPLSPSLTPLDNEVLADGINIPEGPLDSALGLIEILTGRTVLRASNLPQVPFSLVINQPVTKSEALLAIETTLTMNGIAIAPLGDRFVKVVPLNSARVESPDLIEGSTLDLPPSGRIASKLFTFEFVRVEQFTAKIGGLLNPQLGGPMPFEQANALLVTDSISTLQRIETLVRTLDQPTLAGMEPKFYPLVYAKASDLVNKLRNFLQGSAQQQLGTGTTFNADDRTNQVVVICDPRLYPFFDKFIAKLDVRSDPNTRNEVIPLKHADAPEVATLVTQLISGQNQAAQKGDSGRRTNPGGVAVQAPAAANPAASAAAATGINTNEFSTLVTVIADERSNSVVVSGTTEDIRLIKQLIDQIDVMLAQVRVEVVIAEVSVTDNDSNGLSAMNLVVNEGKLVGFTGSVVGAGFAGLGDLVDSTATDATSLISKNYATFTGWDLSSIIALGERGDGVNRANILSSPAIMTTHNKEAHVFVGKKQPTISSYVADSTASTSTNAGYRTTVSSQEVGIKLTVKPLIGSNGSVQLEVKQEISDIIGFVGVDGNQQPIVASRETESFVTVNDGEIIVLSGLQKTSDKRTRTRFGPIPFISDILGRHTKDIEKTDILIFLRPVILTNTEADNMTAMKRVDQMKMKNDVQSALKGDLLVQ